MNDGLKDVTREKTNNGFDVIRFKDLYNVSCSLQKSSLAARDAVWLGAGDERMHLDREMAADLIELLQKFVDDGEI